MRRLRSWIGDRPRGELIAYAALMLAGFLVRAIDLADRPFHHDESQDAYFSFQLYDSGEYEYQPILHGPVRFYLTALVYLLFGDSDFTARLAPALMGTALVGLPYLLRHQLGRTAAFAAAVMLAFGPVFLYFSRFAREDIYIAAINMALVIAVFRYLERPSRAGPAVILGLTAVALATKETTYITLFIAGAFFIPAVGIIAGAPLTVVAAAVAYFLLDDLALALIVGGALLISTIGWEIARVVADRERPDRRLLASITSQGWAPWGYGLATLALVFTLLFTVFLTNPDGLRAGLVDSLDYWLGQHDVGRGGEPWYFYIVVLVGHEWPVLILGAIGIGSALWRRSLLGIFLAWAFVVSLAVYSWAGEKFSWLAMHPLMPLILLAGMGVQTLLAVRPIAGRTAGIALVAVCAAYLGYSSFSVNALHRADPREFLVSTQSSEDVKQVVARVEALDDRVRRRTGRPVTITIDTSEGATYPWAWYFRHLDRDYIEMTKSGYVPQSQVLLMTEASRIKLLPDLVAYEGKRFRFRVWWVRDWDRKLELDAWGPWFLRRETWNPVGGMPGWIFVRRDAAAS